MSDSDRSVEVAIIDRDKDRCKEMIRAFTTLGGVKTFAWYIDGEGNWEPSAPHETSLGLTICHHGSIEENIRKRIVAPVVVFYGGGGGAGIAGEYVIWREVTGKRNAITANEAEELLEFARLAVPSS